MPFILLACTDICGRKVNVELPFEKVPLSLEELHSILEHVFRGEETAIREANKNNSLHDNNTNNINYSRRFAPFKVNRINRYLDESQSWVEVKDIQELHTYDQLYVFRKSVTKFDISTQREIPPPHPSIYFAQISTNLIETRQDNSSIVPLENNNNNNNNNNRVLKNRTSYNNNNNNNNKEQNNSVIDISDQVDTIFAIGDTTQRGYLTVRDFQNIFRVCEIQFPPEIIEDLHKSFAKEKRGESIMSIQDFNQYANEFYQAISIAYTRLKNKERQKIIEEELHQTSDTVNSLQKEKKTLEAKLEILQKQLIKEQEKKSRLQNEAEEIKNTVNIEYREQEQNLLDKEISVFKYRQKLHQEEVDFEKLAEERRRRELSVTPVNITPNKMVSDRYGPRY